MTLTIDPTGNASYLGEVAVDLSELGPVTRRRVSHILPVNPIKRGAFRALRLVFGERGRVAAWTRRWRGPWRAEIIATGQRRYHMSRRVLIAWEQAVLTR